MGSLTAEIPKPLLRLCGRPIIEHILTGLRAAGLSKAIIITGYLADQVETCLGTGARLGMELTYYRQAQPEGTARALLLARSAVNDSPFLLTWGDIVVEPAQYALVVEEFGRVPCAALLAVNAIDDPWQGAAVYVDANWRVTRLIEKPPRGSSHTPWNNAGIFVFTSVIFDYAERLARSARGEYELPQAIGAMLADGRQVRACAVRGFWSDLGRPEDLAAAEQALRRSTING